MFRDPVFFLKFLIPAGLAIFVFLPSARAQAPGQLSTFGVTYNSDSSAAVTRTSSSRIQLPQNLLNPTSGWVAVRLKVGFASTTSLSPDPIIWDMSASNTSDLFVYYDVGTDKFRLTRRKNTIGGTAASPTQTFASGAFKTIIAAWTATTVKISLDGSPFIALNTGSGNIPASSPFLIGSTLVQGAGRQPNSDYYWVAAGTGTLTDSNASIIHNFANLDKIRADFPGSAVFIWWANSDSYNNDSAQTTPTRAPTNPPSSLLGDANGDGRVDGVDYTIWFNHYGTSTGNGPADGDFNRSGRVDGVDYTIWFNHYGQSAGPSPSVTPARSPTPSRVPTSTPRISPTPSGPTPTPPPPPPPGTAPYRDLFGDSFNLVPGTSVKEIPIEIQAWWNPQTGNPAIDEFFGFGHEHLLCFWPIGQAITGVLSTPCRIMLHNNPSTANKFAFHLAPGNVIKTLPLNLECPYNAPTPSNCAWNVNVSLDTGGWPAGWRHLRLRVVQNTADGQTWTTSSEIPFAVKCTPPNCSGGEFPSCIGDPANNKACIIGKSWYTNFDYQNVRINGIPTAPVSGTMTLKIAASKGQSQKLEVFLDRSHFIPAVGPWNAEPSLPNNPPGWPKTFANPPVGQDFTVTIDTTQLPNGWHSLAARNTAARGGNSSCKSACNYTVVNPNFETGVAKFWFFVQN